MSRLLLSCTLLLLLTARATAQTPTAGDRLPPVELQGFSQTEARQYSDFYGRAVLLEFFAFWCAPCAQSVRPLNALQRRYGPRGLSVLAVTREGPTKTEPWVKRHGVEYAYAYDMQGKLHDLFRVRNIPYAVLIDPHGTIVWRGFPNRLREELIEQTLKGALERPVWQWPESARALAVPLTRGDYAAALEQSASLPHEGDFDPAALVRERIAAIVAVFEAAVQDGDYRNALRFAERLQRELGTLPEAQAIAGRAEALLADPEVQEQLDGLDRLEKLERGFLGASTPGEVESLRPKLEALALEFPGTRVERRAQALLTEIDAVLKKIPKPGEAR
jgi:peroxiredoxin